MSGVNCHNISAEKAGEKMAPVSENSLPVPPEKEETVSSATGQVIISLVLQTILSPYMQEEKKTSLPVFQYGER